MDMLRASEASSSSVVEVMQRLRVDGDGGLSAGEAERRRRVHGFNELLISEEEPIWRKYINTSKKILTSSISSIGYL